MDDDCTSIFEGRKRKPRCQICKISTENEKEIFPLFNAKNLQYITSTTDLEFEGPDIEMIVKETLDSVPANSVSAVVPGQELQALESTTLATAKRKKKPLPSKTSSSAHTSKSLKNRNGNSQRANKTKVKMKTHQRNELVYKTTLELQQEHDQQRNEMVIAAEAQDRINHRIAVMNLRKKTTLHSGNDSPPWYQELSTQQMNLAESLGAALYSDMEEGSLSNTRKWLADLGLVPILSRKEIAPFVSKSYGHPILFLFYLAKSLCPAKRGRNEPYSIRERLLLSAMTHLTIPKTLVDLHSLLPTPRKKRRQLRSKLCQHKRKRYTHCYLEPQPIDAARMAKVLKSLEEKEPVDITRSREEVLKVVTLDMQQSSQIPMTKAQISQKQSLYSVRFNNASNSRYPSSERKSTYCIERNKQLQALSYKLCAVPEVEQTVHELNEAPSKFTQNLAMDSMRSSKSSRSINIALPLPCFSTSTDPPEPDSKLSFRMPKVPTNSFVSRAGETSMMIQHQKLHINSMIALKLEAGNKEVDDPVERLVLMGYFEAAPTVVQYNQPQRKTFNTKDPVDQINTDVKKALAELAYEGNPLARLPQAYKLPHFRKWLMRRSGFKMTESYKVELQNTLQTLCETSQSKPYKTELPDLNLSPRMLRNLTWNKRCWFGRKANKIKDKYYSNLRKGLIEDTRIYWPAMGMTYFDNKNFRNVFYAYLPAKEDDLIPVRPWLPP